MLSIQAQSTYTHSHTYTHAHTHTPTHTYTHKHIHTLTFSLVASSCMSVLATRSWLLMMCFIKICSWPSFSWQNKGHGNRSRCVNTEITGALMRSAYSWLAKMLIGCSTVCMEPCASREGPKKHTKQCTKSVRHNRVQIRWCYLVTCCLCLFNYVLFVPL